jgi:hypothetical protein
MTPKFAGLTYHPILKWRCLYCRCVGEVTVPLDLDVIGRWNRVVDAHTTESEFCAEGHRDGGLYVDAPVGAYPEAS